MFILIAFFILSFDAKKHKAYDYDLIPAECFPAFHINNRTRPLRISIFFPSADTDICPGHAASGAY